MEIVCILLDIRSAHNVGSIFRSAEIFGVTEIICAGLTPYPKLPGDSRLPHIADSAHKKIIKTSLGAEQHLAVTHADDSAAAISMVRGRGFSVWALEQQPASTALHQFEPPGKLALILGNEPTGIDANTLALADGCLEIAQYGTKESLNVSVAAGIALYELSKYR